MITIDFICTGDELLNGQTANSHQVFVGAELKKLGLRLNRVVCVNDDVNTMQVEFDHSESADFIILSGGLGPTSDDLTIKTIADKLKIPLIIDKSLVAIISQKLEKAGVEIDEKSVYKQATIPDRSSFFENKYGIAPPVFLNSMDKKIFFLPGPPAEFKQIFVDNVLPIIKEFLIEKNTSIPFCKTIKICGISESKIANIVDQENLEKVEISYRINDWHVDLTISGNKRDVNFLLSNLQSKFGKFLVSFEGKNVSKKIIEIMTKKAVTLSTAESCTGGNIANIITNISGSSLVFTQGFITYSNQAKKETLGVRSSILEKYGAVSEEVAKEMVLGCLEKSNSDFAIAVTGIAGPNSDGTSKEIGLVYIAIAGKNIELKIYKMTKPIGRLQFKQAVSILALNFLRLQLQ